jgi:hypothetical protein
MYTLYNVQLTERGASLLGHKFVMNLEHVHFVQYWECINDADNLDDCPCPRDYLTLQMTCVNQSLISTSFEVEHEVDIVAQAHSFVKLSVLPTLGKTFSPVRMKFRPLRKKARLLSNLLLFYVI